MEKIVKHIHSLSDMQKFAQGLAQLLQPSDLIALNGPLGAGKSTLSRLIIQSLDPSIHEVPSPTFSLVQTYNLPNFILWHFDLYRLHHAEELYDLDIEEALNGVSLVEWPLLIDQIPLPFEKLTLTLAAGKNDEEREMTITCSPDWRKRLNDKALI